MRPPLQPIWTICSAALLLLCATSFVSVTQAADGLSFLFAEDEAIAGTPDQYAGGIETSTSLSNDQWLNAPLTRLDYVLIKIESEGSGIEAAAKDIAGTFFEKSNMGPTRADFSARYSSEKGRIVISLSVDAWGKPIQPMKATCETVLDQLKRMYPLERPGYSWSNNALGILLQGGPTEYDKIAGELMGSAAIVVNLIAVYPSASTTGNDVFQMSCRQQKGGAPTEFFKSAHSLQ